MFLLFEIKNLNIIYSICIWVKCAHQEKAEISNFLVILHIGAFLCEISPSKLADEAKPAVEAVEFVRNHWLTDKFSIFETDNYLWYLWQHRKIINNAAALPKCKQGQLSKRFRSILCIVVSIRGTWTAFCEVFAVERVTAASPCYDLRMIPAGKVEFLVRLEVLERLAWARLALTAVLWCMVLYAIDIALRKP